MISCDCLLYKIKQLFLSFVLQVTKSRRWKIKTQSKHIYLGTFLKIWDYLGLTLGDYIGPKKTSKIHHYHLRKNRVFFTILNRMDRLKHGIKKISVDLHKKFPKKFVIENKLSFSDRRDKWMHYPESPKVTLDRGKS